MKRNYLGEFEELVLLMVVRLHSDAYGVGIMHEIDICTGRAVRLNQVHAALHRLEEKGMVSSSMGEPTPERGGRRKRLFVITAYGKQTLAEIQRVRATIWSEFPLAMKKMIKI